MTRYWFEQIYPVEEDDGEKWEAYACMYKFPTCETCEHIDYTREVIENDQLIVCREYGVVLNAVHTTHFCSLHQDFQR